MSLFLTVATVFPSILTPAISEAEPFPSTATSFAGNGTVKKALKPQVLLPMTDVFPWLAAGDGVRWA